MVEAGQKWAIGPEVDGQVDVLVFGESQDSFWEALAAFQSVHEGENWVISDQGGFGDHSQFVTFERASADD